MPAALRSDDGTVIPLSIERWHGPPTADDLALLRLARPPVLDVGCGPGRHVLALAHRGVVAMGVDAAPSAIRLARSRGVAVLERSVFGRIPGAGRWGTALLLDGNIGIGGDPVALLRRMRELVRIDGTVLVEVDAPWATTRSLRVHLDLEGARTATFPWATVSQADLPALASEAGLSVASTWQGGGRWFAELVQR
jgi:SAM-dependent methyltransferase